MKNVKKIIKEQSEKYLKMTAPKYTGYNYKPRYKKMTAKKAALRFNK